MLLGHELMMYAKNHYRSEERRVGKDLKKEGVFLFFWVAERQREKSKERGVTQIADLSLLGVTFLCIGLNKWLGLRLLHINTRDMNP